MTPQKINLILANITAIIMAGGYAMLQIWYTPHPWLAACPIVVIACCLIQIGLQLS